MAKINRNRRKKTEETDSDSFKTISRYGRRLYWSKRAEAYSVKCVSSHIMAMQYFPKRNIIAVIFWNSSIYEYTCSEELFDIFAQISAGTNSHSVGKTFWSILRRQTTEFTGKIDYVKV